MGPLPGVDPAKETRLCLERGGLVIPGEWQAWAAGPTGEAARLGWLARVRPGERATGAVLRPAFLRKSA